jgi:hypothetical protein
MRIRFVSSVLQRIQVSYVLISRFSSARGVLAICKPHLSCAFAYISLTDSPPDSFLLACARLLLDSSQCKETGTMPSAFDILKSGGNLEARRYWLFQWDDRADTRPENIESFARDVFLERRWAMAEELKEEHGLIENVERKEEQEHRIVVGEVLSKLKELEAAIPFKLSGEESIMDVYARECHPWIETTFRK